MAVKTFENPYSWKPVLNPVFRDTELAKTIHEEGYAILPILSNEVLNNLNAIYQREHSLNVENGGMFYTLYSTDSDYRLRVHKEIQEVLQPVLEEHFKGYKNIVNSFVVKASGKESEFYVHQDTTAVDEFEFSPLSLWIPLHEIDANNGAMTIIEKTHWFFSPFRGVSFGFPFGKILNTVRKYLKPVYLKPGEVLIFDPRVIHNSMKNSSGKDRVAVICGVFEENAKFQTCYKDPSDEKNPIELYAHEDDYTLTYSNFFYDCHIRPTSGTKTKDIEDKFPAMSSEQFVELCEMNGIEEKNILHEDSEIQCNMIAEPDGVNKPELVDSYVPEEPTQKKSGFLSWFKK
ncbi:MAG: phytanoyl-CoA dioxygenase family protein [Crocinitomicaceae bacterium]|nr:phytanoyl-CoA dioxygenase family protein [Crocinitomicaceae bacterium]